MGIIKHYGKLFAPFVHIILILIQPVFALSPYCCMFSGEAINTNFIVDTGIGLGGNLLQNFLLRSFQAVHERSLDVPSIFVYQPHYV
jgi:hypothetical protein